MILDTVQNLYSDLKKKTENEYAGPCPWCGGDDRFIVRTDSNRFFCRGCGRNGDEIAFLMEFKGLSYVEACQSIGVEPKRRETAAIAAYGAMWQPKPDKPAPGDQWSDRCQQLIQNHSKILHQNKSALDWLRSERGLTDEIIKAASLGWNYSDIFLERGDFGLPTELNKKGNPKKMWIPAGLIIPYIIDDKVIRVRVRRSDPGDGDRYILLTGSDTRPMVWGVDQKIFVIVESEIDGLLLHQAAGDLVGVVAMGSAQARPDASLDRILRNADQVLICLDDDAAGGKETWKFWRKNYHSKFKRWPCIGGKDPGEMFQAGINIRAWVDAGIDRVEWIDPLDADQPDQVAVNDPPDPPPPEKTGGSCTTCPACGTWDFREYAGKQLCFHRAYYIGKSGRPVDIQVARLDCPKMKT